ncbi:SEC14-like protein 2 like protein [Argiope bruennichi]|nr:SEC14-like protein 2 like protein [Argiope bruennichi]
MLRKHLEFRKILQIDTILTDYKAPEVCEKYLSQNFLGCDKQGSPVYMSAIGNTDSRGIFKSANKIDVLKCCLKVIEMGLHQTKLQTLKLGKPVTQCVYIYDMDKMTFTKATDRYSIEHFLIAVNVFQDNYPELLKAVYVINASTYFKMVFPVVKAILAGSIIRKMKIFGTDGWQEELLKVMDAKELPACFGGKRTDPDGNPKCNTFINWAGTVPEYYFKTKNVEKFAKLNGVKKVIVPRKGSFEVKIEVKRPGQMLHWEYEVVSHDIAFKLLFVGKCLDGTEIEEIVPMHKFETEYEPLSGFIICKRQGNFWKAVRKRNLKFGIEGFGKMHDEWSEEEKNAVAELRKIMKDEVPLDMYEDKHIFFKFLKARNFNLNQAETMLRNHLQWRKAIQIDTIISDFKPSEVLEKFISQTFIGFDKTGCLIQYAAIGNLDGKGLFKSANKYDVLRCVLQEIEKIKKRLKYKSEQIQGTFVIVLAVELFAEGIQIFQDNYPEFLKKIYIINASVYFTIAFPIIRRILSGAVIDKIEVYGKEGWKPVLLDAIDADVLPAFLGGNRTDPDGDPNCNSFIVHSGPIPEKYYLTKDFSKMMEKDGATCITIERQSKVKIPVSLQYDGSILNWEYEVKTHDIGFGLTSETAKSELIPVHKVETELKSETGRYRCKSAGTYYIIFDNSYSWFNSKEVCYRTWVTDPYDSEYSEEDSSFQIDF